MKTKHLFLLLFLLYPIILCAKKTNFTIGVESINYLPYHSTDNRVFYGFSRDLFDLFAREKGYRFKYVPTPIKRSLFWFLSGKYDFKYPDNSYWSKDQKVGNEIIYSDSIFSTTIYIFLLVRLPLKRIV